MDNFENGEQAYNDDCEYTDEMPVRSAKHGDTLAIATKKVLAQIKARTRSKLLTWLNSSPRLVSSRTQ